MDIDLAKIQQQTQIGVANINLNAQTQSAKIQADGRIQVKQLQNDNEPVKQDAKTQGDKELMREESNLKQQQAFSSQGEG